MFYFTENCCLCNYADDSTLYAFYCNTNVVTEKLYKDFEVLDTWFYDNYMALNPGKWLVAKVLTSRGGGVLPNSDPFGQTKNGGGGCKNWSFFMDVINVWSLYKNLNGLSPPIMLDLFTTRENIYNLRNFRELHCEKKKTIRYGTETVTYKAAHLWGLLPHDI